MGYDAKLVDGVVIPSDWFAPQRGYTRFFDRETAEKYAERLRTFYGPNVFDAKVEEEPSASRPHEKVYQVYIRSLGKMEGLIR